MKDNKDDTVTDTTTGLMWQQETTEKTMTWDQALAYCESLNLGGYTDWRLPSIKELLSIVDYSRYKPAIDVTYFPNTVSSWYWSSTTYAYDTVVVWFVNFYYGFGSTYYKNHDLYIRAVRGGINDR